MIPSSISRREFLHRAAATTLAATLPAAAAPARFRLRHVLSTNQYGTLPLADIVPQLAASGCIGLDVWAGRWGNQREQIDALGHDRFAALLAQHRATVACYTCMDPGFQRCEPHLRAMKKFGGNQIIAGFPNAPGGKDLRGDALRTAIRGSLEKLKPITAVAGELGVELAIENHLNGLLETPDGVRMLAEEIRERHVGIAFAPFHLPQDAALLGKLVDDVAPKILYFYAWQFGDGSGDLTPPRQRRQLPGIGPLDFKPMLAALKRHRFGGYTSVFMHPTPRGSPLHPTAPEVTAELNRARAWIDREVDAA